MTERKIESLFNEALIVSDKLEQNLQHFEKNSKEINIIHKNLSHLVQTIEQISFSNEETKQQEAQKFSQAIKTHLDKYTTVLSQIDFDTSVIESLIEEYNRHINAKMEVFVRNSKTISQTFEENGEAIVAAAESLKKGQESFAWRLMIFFAGVVVGALFLASYPIVEASKAFQEELKVRDEAINTLKEQYETNSNTITFLRKNDITVKTGTTDGSWPKESLRFSPMILLDKQQVINQDETGKYSRIIFSKKKTRNEQ